MRGIDLELAVIEHDKIDICTAELRKIVRLLLNGAIAFSKHVFRDSRRW